MEGASSVMRRRLSGGVSLPAVPSTCHQLPPAARRRADDESDANGISEAGVHLPQLPGNHKRSSSMPQEFNGYVSPAFRPCLRDRKSPAPEYKMSFLPRDFLQLRSAGEAKAATSSLKQSEMWGGSKELQFQMWCVAQWRSDQLPWQDQPHWAQKLHEAARPIQRLWRSRNNRRKWFEVVELMQAPGAALRDFMIRTEWNGWQVARDPFPRDVDALCGEISDLSDCSSPRSDCSTSPSSDDWTSDSLGLPGPASSISINDSASEDDGNRPDVPHAGKILWAASTQAALGRMGAAAGHTVRARDRVQHRRCSDGIVSRLHALVPRQRAKPVWRGGAILKLDEFKFPEKSSVLTLTQSVSGSSCWKGGPSGWPQ